MSTIFGDKVVFNHSKGSATFNDPAMTDWPGIVRCGIDDLVGWTETADKDPVRAPRGTGDGDYIGKRWRSKARMLEIEGYIHAPDRLALDQAFSKVISDAFPEDVDITLTRYEPIPKSLVGRVMGKVEPTQYFPTGMRWRATVLCANPFKFDAINILEGTAGVAGVSTGGMTLPLALPLLFNMSAQGEGNQVVLFNQGTAKAYPLLRVKGPLPTGWRIENVSTGEFSSFDLSLSALDTLIMDHRTKSATLNGSQVSGLITGKWWALAPKSNTLRLYGSYDPAASLYAFAQSYWR